MDEILSAVLHEIQCPIGEWSVRRVECVSEVAVGSVPVGFVVQRGTGGGIY